MSGNSELVPLRGLFSAVPREQLQEVLALARRRRFARGEVVFHRDDPADSLHLIGRGRFLARIVTPLGDSATVSVMGPGEAFGELALVGAFARSTTVSALEDGETRVILKTEFDRLRSEHPGVNEVLVALLAEQLRRSSELLTEAFYVSAERRVLRRLEELAVMFGPAPPITVPLSQEDIAGLAGTSRVTVNRVLRREVAKGVLELGRNRTVILDLAALRYRAR
jgi:CRP/FNR family transcriptional regulator, cyclic AMP receptor protein